MCCRRLTGNALAEYAFCSILSSSHHVPLSLWRIVGDSEKFRSSIPISPGNGHGHSGRETLVSEMLVHATAPVEFTWPECAVASRSAATVLSHELLSGNVMT